MDQIIKGPPKQPWILGWIAPHRSQDNDTRSAASDIAKLCSIFRDLDNHFRAAIQRGCDLQAMPPNTAVTRGDDWKVGLGVNKTDLEDFDGLINDQKSDLQYLQELRKLTSWALAMNYLELEQAGFPGRIVYEMAGNYRQYPAPKLCRASWATYIDQIESIAAPLPRYVLEAAKNGNLGDRNLFEGVHARMVKLDAFLERTYEGTEVHGLRPSYSAQIDRFWPPGIQQIEPFSNFSLNYKIAMAYPGNSMLSTNQTMSIFLVVGFVSIVSAVFAVLSFQQSSERGSWGDADFYSLCQGTLLQVSGIVILIITVFFRSSRLAKQAWRWAWLLSVLSMVTSLVAVPMYGFVSAGWSTIFVVLSGVLQMWVSLMLMFIVSN